MMIPANDPLVRRLAARNLRNHVVHGLDVPVELEFQMYLRRAGPHVIRNRQSAAPLFRSHWSFQSREQRLRIAVGNRQYGNLRQAGSIFHRQPLGIFRGANSRSQRIPRIRRREIHHAAALHAIRIAHRSLRKDIVLTIAIVARLGVDEAADRAMLGRHFRLHPAPRVVVLRDDDRALHGNPQPVQLLVILRKPVVHENKRRSHVAVDGICVVSRKLLRFLVRRRIDGKRGFFQFRRELCGLGHLQQPKFRRWEQNMEGLDVGIQAPFLEVSQDPLCVVLVVGRADMVGARAHALHVRPKIPRIGNGAEFCLPIALRLARPRSVPGQRRFLGGKGKRRRNQGEYQSQGGETSHAVPFLVRVRRIISGRCPFRAAIPNSRQHLNERSHPEARRISAGPGISRQIHLKASNRAPHGRFFAPPEERFPSE